MNDKTKLIQFTKEMFKFTSALSTLIGFFIVFFYCIEIHYFPVGITTGDALLFVWAVISFGLIYAVFIYFIYTANSVYFYIGSIRINKFYKKTIIDKLPCGNNKFFILTFGIIAQIFLWIMGWRVDFFSLILITVLQCIMLILYFIGYCAYYDVKFPKKNKINESTDSTESKDTTDSKDSKTNKNFYLIIFVLIYISIPLIFGHVGIGFIKISFNLIGIRQNNVVIYIDKQYQTILQSRISDYTKSEKNHYLLMGKLNCSEVCNINNVNILFTDIGTKILFEIPSHPDKDGNIKALQFELPASAIKGIERKINYVK